MCTRRQSYYINALKFIKNFQCYVEKRVLSVEKKWEWRPRTYGYKIRKSTSFAFLTDTSV